MRKYAMDSRMTVPKAFIFVLMPFSNQFDDIYQYGIKEACKDAGAYCERVDEQIFPESILERVYNQINKADLIIADLTGRNPNVFYETGYAHALGKRVILLTQNSDDIPFDLKHYPHIIYSGSITNLNRELKRRIRWYLEKENQASREDSSVQFQFYLAGSLINEAESIELPPENVELDEQFVQLTINISLHNPTNQEITPNFTFGLIVPKLCTFSDSLLELPTQLPDGRYLVNTTLYPIRRKVPIGPFCWESTDFKFSMDRSDVTRLDLRIPLNLRIFQASGPKDISFNIELPNGKRYHPDPPEPWALN
jgi:hypothetical protein